MAVDITLALTTYALVKAELGLTDDTLQTYFERKINAVSQKFANYCNRAFKTQTYTSERYEGTDTLEICLKNYPITALTTVIVDDTTITDDVVLDAANGTIYYEGLFSSNGWNAGVSKHKILRFKNVYVTYTAGYVLPDQASPTLPYDLQDACINEVIAEYEKRGTSKNVKSWTLGESSKSYFDNDVDQGSGLLSSTKALLDMRYKKYVI